MEVMCLLRRVSCTMHRLWSLFYAITTCKGCDPWFLMVSSIAPSHWQALSAHPFPRQSPQTQNYCDMVAIVALFVLQASAVPTCGLYGVSPWRTELVKNSVGQMWSCRETSRKSSRIPPRPALLEALSTTINGAPTPQDALAPRICTLSHLAFANPKLRSQVFYLLTKK